jgi:serine/threonine-protein kinase RsbW
MSSSNAPEKLSRELPSELSAYHEFVEEVLGKLQQLGWSEGVLFGIHMALEESISNAIRHGNQGDLQKKVRVDCELEPHRFWVRVQDEGEGYSPDQVPDCRSEENLEQPGGRGLALIRAYMTTVQHSDCGSCLTMEKLLEKA